VGSGAAKVPMPPPLGGGGGGGIASGDYENVDTSPVLTLIFGATVAPNISVFGGFRYVVVQPEGDTGGIDISQYDFLGGGRYSFPLSPTAKGFGEGFLTYSTLAVDFNGQSDSESGLGFGLRGGVVFTVSGNIGIGGAISFTTADINDGDAAWITPEVFASFGF